MRRGLTIAVLAATLLAIPALAQAQTPQTPPPPIDPTSPLFCKDDFGDITPIPYVSLGTVVRKYAQRYNFGLTVQTPAAVASPANPMILVFANPAETSYFISYEAAPYRDPFGHAGIVLLSAHISLEKTDDVYKGSGMCRFTAFG